MTPVLLACWLLVDQADLLLLNHTTIRHKQRHAIQVRNNIGRRQKLYMRWCPANAYLAKINLSRPFDGGGPDIHGAVGSKAFKGNLHNPVAVLWGGAAARDLRVYKQLSP